MREPKEVTLQDPHLDLVRVQIWPDDGDVVLKQGRDVIHLSEAQVEKLIKSLSGSRSV